MLPVPRHVIDNATAPYGISVSYRLIETNHGEMTCAWTDHGLCWTGFGDNSALIAKRFKCTPKYEPDHILPFNMDLDLYGTPFQLSVWRALLIIPHGKIATYHDIASYIGNPKATRAVGTAIGKNPISIIIPCHRVIRTDGGLGEYLWGQDLKSHLLALETH